MTSTFGVVEAALWASFLSGALTLAVGAVHVSQQAQLSACEPNDELTCIGVLRWNIGAEEPLAENNVAWQLAVNLVPDLFLPRFGPLLAGAVATASHLGGGGMAPGLLYGSWARVALWLLFLALFCNFGLAGRLGVAVGFITSFAALLAVVVELTWQGAPTLLGLALGGCARPRFEGGEAAAVAGSVAVFGALTAAVLTVATGIASLVGRLPAACRPDDDAPGVECVGRGLFWTKNPQDSPLREINLGSWGGFFSLSFSASILLYTPLLLGLVSLASLLSAGSAFRALSASWPALLWWHLLLGLLDAGYAGNLGVAALFLCAFVALLALVLHVGDAPPPPQTRAAGLLADLGVRVSWHRGQRREYTGRAGVKPVSHQQPGPSGEAPAAYSASGASGASHSASGGRPDYEVNRWNNGSAGYMDSNKPAVVTESNRGTFGARRS